MLFFSRAKADAITQLNEEVNLLNSKIAALERDARGHKAAAAAAAAAEKAASDMMTIDALHHESLEVRSSGLL